MNANRTTYVPRYKIHSNDTATTQQRHSNDTETTQQRHSNDTATTQQRHSNDTATTQQRHSNDTATTQRHQVSQSTITITGLLCGAIEQGSAVQHGVRSGTVWRRGLYGVVMWRYVYGTGVVSAVVVTHTVGNAKLDGHCGLIDNVFPVFVVFLYAREITTPHTPFGS